MRISLKSRFQYVDAVLRMRFTSYAGEYLGDKGRTFLPFAFGSRSFLSLFTQFLQAVLIRNEALFLRLQLELMREFLVLTVQISASLSSFGLSKVLEDSLVLLGLRDLR